MTNCKHPDPVSLYNWAVLLYCVFLSECWFKQSSHRQQIRYLGKQLGYTHGHSSNTTIERLGDKMLALKLAHF